MIDNKAKGECQNGCFKKTKHAKFRKNEHFLLPDRLTYNVSCFVLGLVE